jgi:hypothetical protein
VYSHNTTKYTLSQGFLQGVDIFFVVIIT